MTKLRMDAMALEIPEVAGHPNRLPFSGVLTHLDVPSDAPPAGARGHRVVMPEAVAQRALASLLGMAVNYAPDAQGHAPRRKVGVITRAEIVDGRMEVGGHLYAKDFPDEVAEIRERKAEMGMSYEASDIRIADEDAAVWVLEEFVFTGAAILEKAAAAFKRTSLAATAGQEGGTMDPKELDAQVEKKVESGIRSFFSRLFGEKDKTAAVSTEQINEAVTRAVQTAVDPLTKELGELRKENGELKAATATAGADARRARWTAALEAAQKAGKVTPAMVPGLAAQAELAISATGKVKIAKLDAQGKATNESEELDPVDALVKYVAALPQAVPLGELAGQHFQAAGVEGPKVLSGNVKLVNISVAQRARALQLAAAKEGKTLSYADASAAARQDLAATGTDGNGLPGGMAAGAV